MLVVMIIVMTSFVNGKNITSRRRQLGSTRKHVSVKICGLALIRMLDMVCTKAKQLVMKNDIASSSPAKREFNIENDPYSRTVSITDYARKLDCRTEEIFFCYSFRI
jgi:hypothetical protein